MAKTNRGWFWTSMDKIFMACYYILNTNNSMSIDIEDKMYWSLFDFIGQYNYLIY